MYGAIVIHLSAVKGVAERIEYPFVPVMAPWQAAAQVAEWAAKRKYGDFTNCCVGFLTPTDKPHTFLASIGQFKVYEGRGVCEGETIEIRLFERASEADFEEKDGQSDF